MKNIMLGIFLLCMSPLCANEVSRPSSATLPADLETEPTISDTYVTPLWQACIATPSDVQAFAGGIVAYAVRLFPVVSGEPLMPEEQERACSLDDARNFYGFVSEYSKTACVVALFSKRTSEGGFERTFDKEFIDKSFQILMRETTEWERKLIGAMVKDGEGMFKGRVAKQYKSNIQALIGTHSKR